MRNIKNRVRLSSIKSNLNDTSRIDKEKINLFKRTINKDFKRGNLMNIKNKLQKIGTLGVLGLGIAIGHFGPDLISKPIIFDSNDKYLLSNLSTLSSNENLLNDKNISNIDNKKGILSPILLNNKIQETKYKNISYIAKENNGKIDLFFPKILNELGMTYSINQIYDLGLNENIKKENINLIYSDYLFMFIKNMEDSYNQSDIELLKNEISKSTSTNGSINGLDIYEIDSKKLGDNYNYFKDILELMQSESDGFIKIK